VGRKNVSFKGIFAGRNTGIAVEHTLFLFLYSSLCCCDGYRVNFTHRLAVTRAATKEKAMTSEVAAHHLQNTSSD
jgi:hypothetical protein